MLEKITDRVFYMPCSNQTDRPALGLICGDKYSLIVDSGNSPTHAKEFLTEINEMSIPPIKYLAITHCHWDHIFGIKEMNLVTISQEKTKEKLNEMKGYKWDDVSLDNYIQDGIFNENIINCIKNEIPDRENLSLGTLDIIYKDSIEIDLGGVICILKLVGGTHTEDSSVIYVPSERVVFLGDCVYGTRYNGEYGYTLEKLLPMIDEIEKFQADHFVISHEELYNKKDIDQFLSQLRNAGELVGTDTSSENATKRFTEIYNRIPSEDEVSNIECFANVNRAMKE